MLKRFRFWGCILLSALLPVLAGCAEKRGVDVPSSDMSAAEPVISENAPTDRSDPTERAGVTEYEFENGISVQEVFSYQGQYVEDGSNEECENVCAIRLHNGSETHYRFLQLYVETRGGSYTFTATTLFAGADMTVLDENRAAFSDEEILSIQTIALLPFDEPPSVHLDELKISYTDGFINVTNLTDATLENVCVYYKNLDQNGYLGGITYRASLSELAAGQTGQTAASHIQKENSRVVFVTYDA